MTTPATTRRLREDMLPMEATPDEWRAMAGASSKASHDSFERCDTDGFLSQWANDLGARLYEWKARVAEHGGTWTFPGLFVEATGERLPAKIEWRPCFGATWKTEAVWRVMDATTGRTVLWVSAFKKGPKSKRAKLGYVERDEIAPADAVIESKGTGLSGQSWVAVVRLDGGFPAANGGR